MDENNIDRYEKIEVPADMDEVLVICPECGSSLILFTGYEMYEEKPVAQNYHCEECDTHFSEEYGDGPFE